MIEYGNIIKIVSTEHDDNEVFFVKHIASDKLILIKTNGTEITVELDKVKEIIIVYVPEEKGYAKQRHLSEGQWVEVTFKSKKKELSKGIEKVEDVIKKDIGIAKKDIKKAEETIKKYGLWKKYMGKLGKGLL